MTIHPIETVIVDASPVSKSSTRSYIETRTRLRVANVTEVRNTDLTLAFGVDIGGAAFDRDPTDTTTADNGTTCIVDFVGNRFKLILNGALFASNNLSDVATPATALANLGGLAKANNLSDVANAATALANLGGLPLPYFLTLSADQNGANATTAQTWFPGGGKTTVTLPAATAWLFDGRLYLVRAAGTTSHTLALLFGGTATFTGINYEAETVSVTGNVLATPSLIRSDVASSVTVTGASVSATENVIVKVCGIIRINGGGTVIPQFQYNAAPGGAPTVKANTYFRLTPLGANTVLFNGPWT